MSEKYKYIVRAIGFGRKPIARAMTTIHSIAFVGQKAERDEP